MVWNPLLNNFDKSIYFSNKMAFHCYYSISAGVSKYLHILDIFNLLSGSLWSFIVGNFYREHQISWKIYTMYKIFLKKIVPGRYMLNMSKNFLKIILGEVNFSCSKKFVFHGNSDSIYYLNLKQKLINCKLWFQACN